MNMKRKMAAVIKEPLEDGDNMPNIAKTATTTNSILDNAHNYSDGIVSLSLTHTYTEREREGGRKKESERECVCACERKRERERER